MCGVVGIVSTNILKVSMIDELMRQSKIRGQHATGISYVDRDMLKSKIIPKDATAMDYKNVNTKIVIGHARYSTSSILYNQPIHDEDISIVHNGVITQEDSSKWDNTSYKFYTKNDSEFILKSYLQDNHPLVAYPEASIASIIYDNDNKTLHFFRNEKRPLYYVKLQDTILIASTKDILKRSGYTDGFEITKCQPCVNYTVLPDLEIVEKLMREPQRDLQ